MALVCYLDDSGNKDDTIATLAGYVAPADTWHDFEADARKLFEEIELPYLHTLDLNRRKNEFKGWSREQTAAFASLFYGILNQHAYAGFEFSVLKHTFEAAKPVYNVELQSSPLAFCLHGIVDRLVKDESIKSVLGQPEVDLSFVVESGHRNENDVRRRFDNIKTHDPGRFGSISFELKSQKIALQAADFLAYFCRRLRTLDRTSRRYEIDNEFFHSAIGEMPHRYFLATDFKG